MKTEDGMEIKILKKADDPDGIVRVSLGGGPAMGGFYCVYRGTKEEALQAMRIATLALHVMAKQLGDKEPGISPDEGKRYA